MKTGEVPEPYPFPAEALRNYARCLLSTGEPTDVYDRFRDDCDRAILTAAPSMSQVKLAGILGISRTTLRAKLKAAGLSVDGRRRGVRS